MASPIVDVLEEIGLHTLTRRFEEEKVELQDIQSLSDADLNRLGVTTIGDRVRLRCRSRAMEEREPTTSAPAPPAPSRGPSFLSAENVRKERDLLFNSRKGKNRNELGRCKQQICLEDGIVVCHMHIQYIYPRVPIFAYLVKN